MIADTRNKARMSARHKDLAPKCRQTRDDNKTTHKETATRSSHANHPLRGFPRKRTSTFDNRCKEFTKQRSATKQRTGADVPRDVTTAQGPEHDGAYLEPVTCLRRSVKAQSAASSQHVKPRAERRGREASKHSTEVDASQE